MENLTPEFLGGAAGVLLSVLFAYAPGVKPWFDALTGVKKRLVLFGAMLLVSVAIFALGCMRGAFGLTCDGDSAFRVVYILTAAVIANQTAYTVEGR
jgi:hypothetical protein